MSDETIRRDIDDLREVVYGNGKEGLRTIMARHELLLNQLIDAKTEQRKFFFGILASIVAAALIGVASFAFAIIRMQSTEEMVIKSVQRVEATAKEAAAMRANGQ